MDKPAFLNFLKVFALKNKINVRIDDIDEILEVLDDNFVEKALVLQLRQAYKNVIKI
jgi:hypothetical protein